MASAVPPPTSAGPSGPSGGASSSSGVCVSVEPLLETAVVEVTPEGQIVQPPLTMEQNLARQAAKIDFSQVHDEDLMLTDDRKDGEKNKDEPMSASEYEGRY